jgi:hypothetical protein
MILNLFFLTAKETKDFPGFLVSQKVTKCKLYISTFCKQFSNISFVSFAV